MALDQITSKIIEDANIERDKILKSAADEKANILKNAENDSEKLRKQILEKAREDADSRRRTALIKSQMESNKKALAAQRQILDSVFSKATELLTALPTEKYRVLMQKVLLNAVVDGTEEVKLNSRETERLGNEFWKLVADALKGSGRKSGIKTVIDDSIADGFIVHGNREQTDCRISTLVSAIRQDLEMDVARILFDKSPAKNQK